MDKLVKEKIKKALDQAEQKKGKRPSEFLCPLRSWDIFVMLREEYKKNRNR